MADEKTRNRPRQGLVQAPVEPVDADGFVVSAAGTVCWVVAFLLVWINQHALDAEGHGWWLGVAAVGIAIGVCLTWWTNRKRRRSTDGRESVEDVGVVD